MKEGVKPDVCEVLGTILQGNAAHSYVGVEPFMNGVGEEELAHLMRLLLNSDWHSSPSRPYRFDKVELSTLSWRLNQGSEMVLSELAQTRTTNTVAFGFSPEEDDVRESGVWWKWIAYAFFSKRARTCSALEHLEFIWINEMRSSDMEMFAAVVAAENPEEVLFDSPPGVVEPREATLQSGSRIQWQFPAQDGDPPPRSFTFEEPVPFVWTFSDDGESEWMDAIVPGYGRCLVQRRDLVFNNSPPVDESRKGIRSLGLYKSFYFVNPADRTGLSCFLSAVAPTLRNLTLQKSMDVSMVLRCCPFLEELVFCDKLQDLRLNFSEFHETSQPLPVLSLNWDNLPVTLAVFSDPDSILA
ncbi:hypothetical protein P3T76_014344 [Phytophthora citrophthora]|uniref:Uncharacterized protein n=1 Tax=Phytophthora citrophthora TaxID=4793 RepID=A0AAD9LB81_9STRA|nr:hypothetical protein P3T76_014344 [Phytophthora citrophthora]